MQQERYEELRLREGAINLAHPEFDAGYHKDRYRDITILICQRKTFEITRMCVESILRFYPDINILVVDGDSQDESTLYLRYKALTTLNFKVYERIGKRHSHGESVDDAIHNHIKTPYVILMDSDTIVRRGGWIEDLRQQFRDNPKLYATGSLMLVTRTNYGCGAPENDNDVLRYAHPSCSMFHVQTYKELDAGGNENGAPFAHNMIAAEQNGFYIGAYPIDKYVQHKSGVSWVKEHQIIWHDDNEVFIRPFITFCITKGEHISELYNQTDRDFDTQVMGRNSQLRIYDVETKDISNPFYQIRFYLTGEYVCVLNEAVSSLDNSFVNQVKEAVIKGGAPDEIQVGGLLLVKRKLFQSRECLQ